MSGEDQEKNLGKKIEDISWALCQGLDFYLGGMWPLQGFPAGKRDISVVIPASSLIHLEHTLCLGLRTVRP